MTLVIDNWAVAVIGFVLAGIGLYLRHYLIEKAKNLATKEDIAELTKTTEQIKAQISHETWDKQTRWSLKRDLYFRLLEILSDLRGALHTIRVHEQLLAEIVPSLDVFGEARAMATARRDSALEVFSKANTDLGRTVSLSPIVIRTEAVTLLRGASEAMVAQADEERTPAENAALKIPVVEQLMGDLVMQARIDLGIDK